MADALGVGSGRPNIPRTLGDFSVASVVVRTTSDPPTDADWGAETPPVGTLVIQYPLLWTRTVDGWSYAIPEWNSV